MSHRPARSPVPATSQVRVVGGPSSGTVMALRPGRHIVGRDPRCDLVLADPRYSREHLAIEVSASGVDLIDVGSTNGVLLEDVPLIQEPRRWPPDQLAVIGASALMLVAPDEPPAVVRVQDGRRLISSVPRVAPVSAPEPIPAPEPE